MAGKSKTGGKKQQKKADNYDDLAREVFPEMNASLYRTAPTTYFRMRLASVALQLNPPADIVGDQAAEIGVTRAEWRIPDDEDMRLEYVALEVTVLLHHAAETLLRLFIAHLDTPKCPWMEVTRLTDFRKFKDKIDSIRRTRHDSWNREQIATVLLGGRTLAESGLDIDQAAWDDHLEAAIALIQVMSARLLDDSQVYNSAKHGLSGIVEASTKMEMRFGSDESGEGETFRLNDGPVIAFPFKQRNDDPEASSHAHWRFGIHTVQIDEDMATIELICKTIDSIMAVARRRYVGHPGRLWLLNQKLVWATLMNGTLAALKLMSGYNFTLATEWINAEGVRELSGVEITLSGHRVADEVFDLIDAYSHETDSPVKLELPEQERFRRVVNRNEHILPFSPNGSSTRLASEPPYWD